MSSEAQVQRLNASFLAGNSASAFVQGNGKVQTGISTIDNQSSGFLVGTYPDASIYLEAVCDPSGPGSGEQIDIYNLSATGAYVSILSASGVSQFPVPAGSNTPLFGGAGMFVTQVVSGARVMTFTATAVYTSGTPDVCSFTGQLLSNTDLA